MSWVEQYERVQRGLRRITAPPTPPREDFEDDLFHFFVDCWHLKDWVKEDSANISYRKRKRIVSAAEKNDVLQVCRAIANSRKHFKRRKKPRGRPLKPEAEIVGGIKVGSQGIRIDYEIFSEKGKKVAVATELAKQAVEEWTTLLRRNGVRLPTDS